MLLSPLQITVYSPEGINKCLRAHKTRVELVERNNLIPCVWTELQCPADCYCKSEDFKIRMVKAQAKFNTLSAM